MKCPRCNQSYNKSSLSRLDNETEICSSCGNWEAMMDFRFLSGINSIEKIHDRINVLCLLVSTTGKMAEYDNKYFEKLKKILNARLEKIHKSN